MTRNQRKTLVYLEIILKVAKYLRGQNTHLLVHESVSELYMWCKKHQRNTARYYDYENPENNKAEFIALLQAPLGQSLLGPDYANLEQTVAELTALQRAEEARVTRRHEL